MEEKQIIEGEIVHPIALPIIGAIAAFISLVVSSPNTRLPYAWFWIVGIPILLVAAFVYWWFGCCKIVVTNLRVYGKTAFGKQVDLPLDSITSIGSSALFHRVSVFTPSGAIVFYWLKNATEVFNTISGLLQERARKVCNEKEQ